MPVLTCSYYDGISLFMIRENFVIIRTNLFSRTDGPFISSCNLKMTASGGNAHVLYDQQRITSPMRQWKLMRVRVI